MCVVRFGSLRFASPNGAVALSLVCELLRRVSVGFGVLVRDFKATTSSDGRQPIESMSSKTRGEPKSVVVVVAVD